MKKVVSYFLAGFFLITQTSCFGGFELTKKVYQWNDSAVENKFVKTLLMYAMFIIPVYELAALGDFIIFNLIEFWSGSNPVAMNEGDIETQTAQINGEEYLITATKNQFKFEKITSKGNLEIGILKFDESTKTWNLIDEGVESKLVQIEGNELKYFTSAGELKVPMSTITNLPIEELAAK